MTVLFFAATWWALAGLIIGLNKARDFPGPQDGLRWAAGWAAGWPVLWFMESTDGR